jgi:molybdenum cofactor biosynthesis enzyme
MDEVITKMEAKHKVDLAAAEVYDIVKTVDAIKNIANNHGLSDELVYELKANFR